MEQVLILSVHNQFCIELTQANKQMVQIDVRHLADCQQKFSKFNECSMFILDFSYFVLVNKSFLLLCQWN